MLKIDLINTMPPLQELHYRVGNTTIFVKRDDLIGFGGGGNKVRLFEYIGADIINRNAEKIITFGSVYSNHIRVAATVASFLGILCDLIILYDGEIDVIKNSPNIKLIRYCNNVHIEYCITTKAHDFIDDYLKKQDDKGCKYYWIPGGGHLQIAVNGYKEVAKELLMQMNKIIIDNVFLPCGTGITQAGLIAGLENETVVHGITVARSIERCKKEIADLLRGIVVEIEDSSINVIDNPISYGDYNNDVREIIGELVKSDGMYLDPIYNAKTFLAMRNYLENHQEILNAVILMKSVLLKNDKSLDFTGLEGIFNTAGLFLISKYLKIETFWVKKMCCWRMKKEKNRQ